MRTNQSKKDSRILTLKEILESESGKKKTDDFGGAAYNFNRFTFNPNDNATIQYRQNNLDDILMTSPVKAKKITEANKNIDPILDIIMRRDI